MIGTCTFTATGTKQLLSPTIGSQWSATLVGKTSSGNVTATVIIEGSNTPGDADSWFTVDTLTLNGASPQKDTYSGTVGWGHARARCTALTGTGKSAVVSLCSQP